ncbi:MAG TPA: hypothetical protein DCP78_16670 [Sphingobacterium sp.]|nr:hypothetical protein [Sphingobacterium sp.]
MKIIVQKHEVLLFKLPLKLIFPILDRSVSFIRKFAIKAGVPIIKRECARRINIIKCIGFHGMCSLGSLAGLFLSIEITRIG